jgi:hypothetical protein
MIQGGVPPLPNLKNILFQNKSIENTKLGTQIWNHQSSIPLKSRWGIIFHK